LVKKLQLIKHTYVIYGLFHSLEVMLLREAVSVV